MIFNAKKLLFLLFALSFIAACAANPKVVKVKEGNEYALTCPQIQQQMQEARYHKKLAREDDKFKLSYLSPTNAIVSIFNINRAETAAIERIKYLHNVAINKGCYIFTSKL